MARYPSHGKHPSHGALRRDIFKDPDITAGYAKKLGTSTALVFGAVADRPEVNQQALMFLLAAAHYADMMRMVGRTQPIYPRDVAEIVGASEVRTRDLLGDLKRLGLLEGTAAAGYTLAPALRVE